jgi:acetyl-CoA carboxylase biotin carboxyl carrier protein
LNKKQSRKPGNGGGNGGANRASNNAASNAASGPMDVALLERIVKLMAANDLNTVDVRDGDKRVILKRGAVQSQGMMMVGHAPAPQTSAPPAHAIAAPPAAGEDAGMTQIKSPMVGTFYSSGSPEAKPFVSVGTVVDEESDVCIIEAMKVFNNIKAECRGTITRILVTNGQTVEFGQPLFLVKPA